MGLDDNTNHPRIDRCNTDQSVDSTMLTFDKGWAADKIGRKKGVAIGAAFCLLGSALMSGSVNSNMVRDPMSLC